MNTDQFFHLFFGGYFSKLLGTLSTTNSVQKSWTPTFAGSILGQHLITLSTNRAWSLSRLTKTSDIREVTWLLGWKGKSRMYLTYNPKYRQNYSSYIVIYFKWGLKHYQGLQQVGHMAWMHRKRNIQWSARSICCSNFMQGTLSKMNIISRSSHFTNSCLVLLLAAMHYDGHGTESN